MWEIKTIEELSSLEFYEILKLRIDTFVVEQKRIYHELDENDKIAYHFYYQREKNGLIQAYARVIKTQNHITFGRVVTSRETRGTGLGKEMIKEILNFCQKKWTNEIIIIEAQKQVVSFYKMFEFEIYGDEFIFEGTPHVEMRYYL